MPEGVAYQCDRCGNTEWFRPSMLMATFPADGWIRVTRCDSIAIYCSDTCLAATLQPVKKK